MASGKLWGGRFEGETHAGAEHFTASLPFDHRLWSHDIEGSQAWARALGKAGVLSAAEAEAIIKGLDEIRGEIEAGTFPFRIQLEDIHMNVEGRLIEKIGEVGGKLHTGRSRNDQVALDVRLYLRDEVRRISGLLRELQRTLIRRAEETLGTPMPGYTHMQRAQPILLSHHLLAYVSMLQRDRARYRDCLGRIQVLPLGSGALAGTTFPIDRNYLAELLGFPRVSENSLDAVSDRDFVIEFLSASAICSMHLSRLAGELVLWATAEFGFVEFPDAFSTGSSIMPQKKNPDVAELVRGKSGRVYGDLVAVLSMMKGLPLAYNADMQEDKEPLFDAIDTVGACLEILIPLMDAIRFNEKRMRAAAGEQFSTATDMADYLVRKGLPFRQAHEVVGRVVRRAMEVGKRLEELSLSELQDFSPLFNRDISQVLSVEASLAARYLTGGTAPEAVRQALAQAKAWVEEEG